MKISEATLHQGCLLGFGGPPQNFGGPPKLFFFGGSDHEALKLLRNCVCFLKWVFRAPPYPDAHLMHAMEILALLLTPEMRFFHQISRALQKGQL